MAQGYQWSAWSFVQASAADIDATAVNNAAELTSDEISLDGKAACEIALASAEDNTGACAGTSYCYILGQGGDGTWQVTADFPLVGAAWTQTQNATNRRVFDVLPSQFGSFKLLFDNNCGQQVAASLKIRTATFDDGT
jgi:hypothetical protein